MPPVLESPGPVAIAHRGSRLLWPENTMAAFAGAVEMGMRWLETDLHATRDGVLVCLHDDTLDRTTDGHGPVSACDFDALRTVDAGYHHAVGDDHPFRGAGARVPALEEVARSFPEVRLVLDLKEDAAVEPLAGLVRRLDLWERIVVGSFSTARVRRFRRLMGERVATSTGMGETFRFWVAARTGISPPHLADALQVPLRYRRLRVVTARTVLAAHEAGYRVHVWTVNDPAEMEMLLEWGVDGVISDRPDLLRGVLEARGAWGASG